MTTERKLNNFILFIDVKHIIVFACFLFLLRDIFTDSRKHTKFLAFKILILFYILLLYLIIAGMHG